MFMSPKPNVASYKPLESELILLKTISFLRFALNKSSITLSLYFCDTDRKTEKENSANN